MSKQHEERVAAAFGGRRLQQSGGRRWSRYDSATDRGDVTTESLHIEHKRAEPQTKSIGVTRNFLAKVTSGAKRRTKIPAMCLTFQGAKGHDQDWLMIPMEVALRLMGSLEGDDE